MNERAAIAVLVLTLGGIGCGGGSGSDSRPGDARSATAAVLELRQAFAQHDATAICRRMTPEAKLEAGRVAHGKPGGCEDDLREAFNVIERGGGFSTRAQRISATRVAGNRAAVGLAGRYGQTAVPLAWRDGRWLLDSFFGTPPAVAAGVAANARRRPFPPRAVAPVTFNDDTGQPCFDPLVDLPTVSGDCGYRASGRVPISIATVFGEFRFGVCHVSVQATTGADGRAWTTFAVSSPVNNGCADIRPCSVGGERMPWKSRISRTAEGSLNHRIDVCLDTCIGAYTGQLTLSLPRDAGSRTVRAATEIGTSGLAIHGHLTVTSNELRNQRTQRRIDDHPKPVAVEFE